MSCAKIAKAMMGLEWPPLAASAIFSFENMLLSFKFDMMFASPSIPTYPFFRCFKLKPSLMTALRLPTLSRNR